MMKVPFLIGRIITGGFWLMNAMNHFTKTESMSEYAASKGVPEPRRAVLGTGMLQLVGGLGLLLGVMPRIAVAAIATFLIPTSLIMHDFWAIDDPQEKMNQQVNFMKNMGLLGSVLMLLAIDRPWPLRPEVPEL